MSNFNQYVHAHFQKYGGNYLSDEAMRALVHPLGGDYLSDEAINCIYTPIGNFKKFGENNE